jgi:excisionase family DNA binding protein
MATATDRRSREDVAKDAFLADGFVKIPEACAFLQVSIVHLYKLMQQGDLKYVKMGKCRRIAKSELRRYAREAQQRA